MARELHAIRQLELVEDLFYGYFMTTPSSQLKEIFRNESMENKKIVLGNLIEILNDIFITRRDFEKKLALVKIQFKFAIGALGHWPSWLDSSDFLVEYFSEFETYLAKRNYQDLIKPLLMSWVFSDAPEVDVYAVGRMRRPDEEFLYTSKNPLIGEKLYQYALRKYYKPNKEKIHLNLLMLNQRDKFTFITDLFDGLNELVTEKVRANVVNKAINETKIMFEMGLEAGCPNEILRNRPRNTYVGKLFAHWHKNWKERNVKPRVVQQLGPDVSQLVAEYLGY